MSYVFNPFTSNFDKTGGECSEAYQHAATELKTIEMFSLSTNNLLTDTSGYDIIISNDGSILYTPTEG